MNLSISSDLPRVNAKIHAALDENKLDIAFQLLKEDRPRIECSNDYALFTKLTKLDKISFPLVEQIRGRLFASASAKNEAYIQYAIDQKLKHVEFDPSSNVTDADIDKLTLHNPEITRLKIPYSSQLENCGEALNRLTRLEELVIDHCPKYKGSVDCSKFPQLKKLDIRFCEIFTQLENLACATELEVFYLFFCNRFDAELDFQNAYKLRDVKVIVCKSMSQPIKLREPTNLQYFSLSDCPLFNHPITLTKAFNLKKFSLISDATFNQYLDFSDADSLTSENCRIEECNNLDRNRFNAIKAHFVIKEFETTINYLKTLTLLHG